MRRVFDLFFGIIIFIISLPILITAIFLIKISDVGPAFFTQKRVGKNGKEFIIYKLRTMRIDADKIGPELTEKDDPRITPVGKFLRKLSIDELPQLINVIKGDMSLVGPRPEIPSIVKTYDKWQIKVLAVKPGITGLSQVNGRAELSIPTKLRFDIYYIKHQSIWLDFKILLKTAIEVIKRRGAY
ncbi:MAG: sugar transferase [Candidatus Firestonebacteria bacterium]